MSSKPLLEARGIFRRFGHVQALNGADLVVYPAEICALIGDNGAGKSSLVKILAGADKPDAGEIWLEGTRIELPTPIAAQRLGIATVYQDLALAPDLSAATNLFLGREQLTPGLRGRLGFVDRRQMRKLAAAKFADLGVTLRSPSVRVASLSGGQRQSIAIARAALWANKVIFMDEPTAALGVFQTARVLDLMRNVRDQGIAVVLISHNLPQVLEISDRIEVLRLGRRVAQFNSKGTTIEDLVTAMTSGGWATGEEPR